MTCAWCAFASLSEPLHAFDSKNMKKREREKHWIPLIFLTLRSGTDWLVYVIYSRHVTHVNAYVRFRFCRFLLFILYHFMFLFYTFHHLKHKGCALSFEFPFFFGQNCHLFISFRSQRQQSRLTLSIYWFALNRKPIMPSISCEWEGIKFTYYLSYATNDVFIAHKMREKKRYLFENYPKILHMNEI